MHFPSATEFSPFTVSYVHVRVVYALLCLGTAAFTAPLWRLFFLSERWGGYLDSGPWLDRIHRPAVMVPTLALWLASLVSLGLGALPLPAAGVNLVLAYYFFIHLRWKGLPRGMGAPGFLWYWLGFACFLLECAVRLAPDQFSTALYVVRFDFGIVMLTSGVSKLTSGYFAGEGLEYGLANPMWCYYPGFYRRQNPRQLLFRLADHAAWVVQILAGVVMMVPSPWSCWGAIAIAASFVGIATHIRLGLLCEMVILGAMLFLIPPALGVEGASPLSTAFSVLLLGYVAVRGLATLGLWYNYYSRRRLPGILQRLLDRVTNLFGIILWRVFTIDQLSFFINIQEQLPNGERKRLSHYTNFLSFRWGHVGESIAVTTIFTTLKYYPDDWALFERKLLRYAKTLPCDAQSSIVFEYIRVSKGARAFAFESIAEFIVEPGRQKIRELSLSPTDSVRGNNRRSVAHPCAEPGTYAPAPSEKVSNG